MVTAVKSAPEGTGTEKAALRAFHNIEFLMGEVKTMLYGHAIEKRCFKTGLDIASCSGCREISQHHISSVPAHTSHARVLVAPHAHELPRALRDRMEEVITILTRI